MKRFVIWLPNVNTRTIFWDRRLGPQSVIRRWSALSSRSSARGQGGRLSRWRPVCPIPVSLCVARRLQRDRTVSRVRDDCRGGTHRRRRVAKASLRANTRRASVIPKLGTLRRVDMARKTFVGKMRMARSRRPHSISAGLDYAAVGPSTPTCVTGPRAIHLRTDDEALNAFSNVCAAFGRHHVRRLKVVARDCPKPSSARLNGQGSILLVNLSDEVIMDCT